MKIFKLPIIIFSLFLLMGLVFLSRQTTIVIAQGNPTETPTPNPTIESLEEKTKKLETEIKTLQERRDTDKDGLQNQIDKALMPVYIGGVILAGFGVSTAFGLWLAYKSFTEKTRKQLEEETRTKLDQAFYNADPLFFPLYVPANGFELETKKLKKLGFKDVRKYGGLREGILNGVIVVRIPGENFRDNREDQDHAESALNVLKDFMEEHKAYEKNVAFVLYITGGQLNRANELTAKYDNVVIANMPVTVAGHVYALVRGLTSLSSQKEDS